MAIMTYAVSARIAVHYGDTTHAHEELVCAQLVRPLATYGLPCVAVGV
jgi:hypothetical protein